MSALAAPFTFANGSTIKNRYMLAALTNLQSGADGVLSDECADGRREARREATGGEHGHLLRRVADVRVLALHLRDARRVDHGCG